MTHSTSYDFQNEYRGPASELGRLRDQTLLSWEREARLLTWLGLRDGRSVLEVGCGPGYVTEQLLNLLPHSSITALDADAAMVQRATEHLQAQAHRDLRLVHAPIEHTGFLDHQFDFAIARYVFQHLPDPIEAAREVKRVLRPGGKFVIIDVDARLWGIVEPFYPQLQAIYAKATQAQSEQGGNRLIGRQLWRILMATGFARVELESFVYHSDALGLELFSAQLDPDRLARAFKAGQISAQELQLAHDLYQQFLASPNAYVLMVGLLAYGEKPE